MAERKSRTSAFLTNSFWSMALMVVNTIVGFIVPHSIIGCYGSSVNGLVNSLTQLVSYISLVQAGTGAAAVFSLYGPLARGDQETVDAIVTSAKRFYFRSGLIFTVLILGLAIGYPLVVDVPGLSALEVCIIVVSLGATGFLDFFTLAKYQVLLTASQQNWVVQIASIVYKVLYAAIVVAMTELGAPVVWVYVCAVGAILVRSAILLVFTRRAFPSVNFSSKRDFSLDQRWDAFFLQVLGAVQSGAPVLIATFLLKDLTVVSVYTVYMLVANGIQNIGLSFSSGTQASFGDVIARGETSALQRAFAEFQTSMYSLNGVLCGIAAALIVPFVDLYTAGVADVDYSRPLLGVLVMLNVLLYHLKTPQGLLVISAGHYRQTRLQTSTQTAVLIAAGIVGGWLFGIEGVVAGACLSNLYRDVDLMFYVPRKITGTNPMDTLGKMLACVLIAAAIAVPYFVLSPSCGGWGDWFLHAFALGAWGVAVALAVCYVTQRRELMGLLRRLHIIKG